MRLTAALLAAALLAAPARAYRPAGFPGSTWGNVSRDFSGLDGSGSQGKVAQGVDWLTLPRGWAFESYAGYQWRVRSRNETFYDENGPTLGSMFYGGPFALGAEFSWERFTALRETTRDFSVFGTWYWRRDLRRAMPLSTWGRLDYDLSDVEGYGSQGWLEQGYELRRWGSGLALQAFGAFRWRLRSRNNQYYDAFGPAAGVHLLRGPLDLDLEYAWRRYPRLEQWTAGPQLSLSWYFSWDLSRAR